MSDEKENAWGAIIIICFIVALAIGLVVDSYNKTQVKIVCFKTVEIAIQNKVEPPKCNNL